MLQKFNPKNADIQVFVGDQLYHRDEAKVSVFDSVVQGGDAVEVFVTGTMGELTSVVEVDKRKISNKAKTTVLTEIQAVFSDCTKQKGVKLPFV